MKPPELAKYDAASTARVSASLADLSSGRTSDEAGFAMTEKVVGRSNTFVAPQVRDSRPAGPSGDTRPSVLLLNSFYTPFVVGGAEVVTEMLATTLAAQGHRVAVATSCSRDQAYERELLNGVDIHRFFPKNRWWLYERFAAGDRRSAIDKIRWRITDAWNRDAGNTFGEILEHVRPDIVHTHNIKGFSPVVWNVAKQKGIPVVHTAHSYELICAAGSLLDRRGLRCDTRSRCTVCKIQGAWYQAQATSIDVFCTPSNFLLQAHAEAGFVPSCSALVRNGVPSQRPLPAGLPTADRPIRYLYLGQLSAHKGVYTLIEAIRLTGRSPFRIDIAGRGDAETAFIELAAQDSRVQFHGFAEKELKDQLIADADVLIFPSIWVENAPMSIAEAFRNGLPVIGSRVGSIPEFVMDGDNGLLFEPGNAASLAESMMLLIQRPDEIRRIREGARRSGASWPTPEVMASEYVNIYRSLMKAKAGISPPFQKTSASVGVK